MDDNQIMQRVLEVLAEQVRQGAEQARQAAEQSRQAKDMAEIKDLLKAMYPLLLTVNARGDEQSKRIDDLSRILASMVPQRLAAVGER